MKKPSLLVIFLTVFIDLVGFGIVLPLLPLYGREFGASGFQLGLLIASFSAMQFLVAPAWGRLSDRIGRRPVLLISNAGSAVSYALFAFASTMTDSSGLWLLMLSRVFAGACGANLFVASAYIADITPREKRSKSMGLIGMAFGLGFIFGPAIGALSAKQLGMPGPGIVAAVFCTANFILAWFILRESLRPSSEHVAPRPKLSQWTHTLRQPRLGLLIGIYFLATFCFTCFESTFSLLLFDTEHFRYDKTQVGYLFAFSGIIAVIVQGGAIGRLVKRFGEARLIAFGLIVVAAGMAVLPFVTTLGGLLFGLGLFAAGSGINRPPTFGLMSLSSPPDEQGAVMGVAQSAGSLARIIGPIFAATLYQVKPVLPYVIAAGLALLAGLIAWFYLCRAPRPVFAEQPEKVGGTVK